MKRWLIQIISTGKAGKLLKLYLTMGFTNLWNWFSGWVGEGSVARAREVVECLMGDSVLCSEEHNNDMNTNNKSQVNNISVGNEVFTGNCDRSHECYTWRERPCFAQVLTLCGMLCLRTTNYLSWRKFQGSPKFRWWHGYGWLLLTGSTVGSGAKSRAKNWKKFVPDQKGCKVGAKKSVIADQNTTIKKNSEKKKEGLRAPQESGRPHQFQNQGYKALHVRREPFWSLLQKNSLRNCFPRSYFILHGHPSDQRPHYLSSSWKT